MKIIDLAREQKDLLNEGIAYIAVWTQGSGRGKRSWFGEDFFPADMDKEEPIFDEEQKTRLAEIAAIDPDAVLLNGYYHVWIGSMDEPLNATQISVGIKKHYEIHNCLISGYLADEIETAEETPAFESLPLTEREELGLGQERHDPIGEDGMQASDVPETITIELPFTGDEDILRSLLQSKATLITAALGEDAYWYSPEPEYTPENPGGWYGPAPAENILPIEFGDGTVKFEWLRFGTDSDTVAAWSAFLTAAVKFSLTAKRVTAKDKAVENEKFAFRTFLVKIGMNDITNKVHRKRLLKNLKGDAAFATQESKAKWQAKHTNKKGDANNE